MMGVEDVVRRVGRLEELSLGLAREVIVFGEADDPLLYLERKAYLGAIREALSGVEAARVAMSRARMRLNPSSGEG